jgi:hypothetical protein
VPDETGIPPYWNKPSANVVMVILSYARASEEISSSLTKAMRERD